MLLWVLVRVEEKEDNGIMLIKAAHAGHSLWHCWFLSKFIVLDGDTLHMLCISTLMFSLKAHSWQTLSRCCDDSSHVACYLSSCRRRSHVKGHFADSEHYTGSSASWRGPRQEERLQERWGEPAGDPGGSSQTACGSVRFIASGKHFKMLILCDIS